MFYPASPTPKETSLEFLCVAGGWIEFVLIAGQERFETLFSVIGSGLRVSVV